MKGHHSPKYVPKSDIKIITHNFSLQHAVVFVNGEQYYGAKANINVWTPRVTDQYEFSLSQIWVIAGSFGNDLNTIEAGWQVCLHFLFSV